jgi:hypothetical protein
VYNEKGGDFIYLIWRDGRRQGVDFIYGFLLSAAPHIADLRKPASIIH